MQILCGDRHMLLAFRRPPIHAITIIEMVAAQSEGTARTGIDMKLANVRS